MDQDWYRSKDLVLLKTGICIFWTGRLWLARYWFSKYRDFYYSNTLDVTSVAYARVQKNEIQNFSWHSCQEYLGIWSLADMEAQTFESQNQFLPPIYRLGQGVCVCAKFEANPSMGAFLFGFAYSFTIVIKPNLWTYSKYQWGPIGQSN